MRILVCDDGIPETVEARFNVVSGKRFRCDFMREGPVYYPEIKKGIEVIRREKIKASLDTLIGKPLVLDHIDARLNVADPEVFAKVAHGVVDKVGFDSDTGWFFCEGEITSEKALAEYAKRNPSIGFRVNATGPGGRWNNVPYERELTALEFHHLALDSRRPRYEEADFRLNAVTNDKGEITMFKFLFRKKDPANPDAAPVTVEHEVPADTVIKVGEKEVRLNSIIEAEEAAQKQAAADAEKKRKEDEAAAEAARLNSVTDETEVLVAGKPMKVKDLRASYEARENAVKTAAAREAAEGRKSFSDIERARGAGAASTRVAGSSNSLQEQVARGQDRYGSGSHDKN